MGSLASPAMGAMETGSLGLAKSGEGKGRSRIFGGISDSKPPWAVEAPGGAEARYGLGLDSFFEHQESLRITFMEQTIQARDLLTGREESGVVRTDPGLLNRKFDLRWDLVGVGVQPAVAFPLPRTLGLYSTLVLQAASADVSLSFHDRNRPGDTSSLEGRGPLFGTGLDLTRSLCRSCPWFAGASYRFQRLPSLTTDRSSSFRQAGFKVLEDEVRLSRDAQEASARIGYGFSGNRVVSYLGVSQRRNEVEIEDHLRYLDPFGEVETDLFSRTRLESEVTLALAGVEARLGPRLFSRMETSVGERDWGVLFRVVYFPSRATTEPDLPSIAAQIRAIRAELVKSVNNLPEIVELAVVNALLDRIERKLLAVLPFPELAAMQDSVRDQFRKAREVLARETAGASSVHSRPRAVPAALRTGWFMSPETAPARLAPQLRRKPEVSGGFDAVVAFLDLLIKRFENDDVKINLCVRTEPAQGASVVLYPLSYPEGSDRIRSNDKVPLRRGLYAYRVTLSNYGLLQCPETDSDECRLDLLSRDRPFVRCALSKSKTSPEGSCTVTDEPPGRWECKSP
jgi:hypothetical protein